ncbi:hypothetical protein [Roseomonas elaeocarpi]|uniref:Uncharacterized protein n=1 Tax=Roseomonas elaeocarpi TaxID=907779 RepID=A0ABV6JVM8_9PROT
MAEHAFSTSTIRRDASGAQVVALPRRAGASAALNRAALEDIAARAIEALDALDAPHQDREPETVEEGDADEASLQPASLCPNLRPAVVVHTRRREVAR